jgi:hypothetical protein
MLVNKKFFNADLLPASNLVKPWIERAKRTIIALKDGQIEKKVFPGHQYPTPVLAPEIFSELISNLKEAFFTGLQNVNEACKAAGFDPASMRDTIRTFQFNLTLDAAIFLHGEGLLQLSPGESFFPEGNVVNISFDTSPHIHSVEKIRLQSLGYSSPKQGQLTFYEILGEQSDLNTTIPSNLLGDKFTPPNQEKPDDQLYLFIDGMVAHMGKIFKVTKERILTFVNIVNDTTLRIDREGEIHGLRTKFLKAVPKP